MGEILGAGNRWGDGGDVRGRKQVGGWLRY